MSEKLNVAKGLREALVDPIKEDWNKAFDSSSGVHRFTPAVEFGGHQIPYRVLPVVGPPIRTVENVLDGNPQGAAFEAWNSVTKPGLELAKLLPYAGSTLASIIQKRFGRGDPPGLLEAVRGQHRPTPQEIQDSALGWH